MNIARIEHELFVLMLHLNREACSETIRTTFVEELNKLFSPVSFRFSEKLSVNAIGMITVATLINTFGSIEIMDKENALSTDMIHVIRNACNMLAIILENLIGRERLADENVRLEEAVRQRTRELSEINDRLNLEIHEKTEVEKSLTEAKKLMSNAIENAPIGMALLETNGRFYRVNQSFCSMLGFSEAEMLKMDFQAITHPEDSQVGPVMMLKILTGEQDTSRYTKRYIRKDGETVNVKITTTLLRDDRDEPAFYLIQVENVTEQVIEGENKKKREQLLQQAQKMESIGTLAGGIAHDFNNILGIILGNNEMAAIDAVEGTMVHQCLKESIKACIRAKELVRQVLDFSRKNEPQKEKILLTKMMTETMTFIRTLFPPTVVIVTEIPEMDETIYANTSQLNRVLINLMTNAAQAMENHGKISVRLKCETVSEDGIKGVTDLEPGSYAKISVSDTGCGIGPDIIGKIFDPYFTTRSMDKGSGLGLAVVYRIVKNHSGVIRVISELGAGTTIDVYLPLIEEAIEESVSLGTMIH